MIESPQQPCTRRYLQRHGAIIQASRIQATRIGHDGIDHVCRGSPYVGREAVSRPVTAACQHTHRASTVLTMIESKGLASLILVKTAGR